MSSPAKRHKLLVLVLFAAALAISLWAAVAAYRSSRKGAHPDLTGTWAGGGDWGSVALERAGPGVYEGTYSSTYGRGAGRITLEWNARAGLFEGAWSEGSYRHGRLEVQAGEEGDALLGSYSADSDCEFRPGEPSRSEFRWSRRQPPEGGIWIPPGLSPRDA